MASEIFLGPDGGPYVSVNENSGDIELKDNSGNVVAFWDESNTQWDFQSNDLTNVGAVDTADIIDGGGVSHTAELADLADLIDSGFAYEAFFSTTVGGGSIAFLNDKVELRQPGDAAASDETRMFNANVGFDPSSSGTIRVNISNITIDDTNDAQIRLHIDDTPDTSDRGSDVLEIELRGSGAVVAVTSENGSVSSTTDNSQNNSFAANAEWIEISWDGAELTAQASDGTTTVTVSDSGQYPSGENLHLKIFARDNGNSAANNADFDVDNIEVDT
jgi:hypothetical protein